MALNIVMILSAVVIGIGVGIVLQRGRGCTNTAFRNLILANNNELSLFLICVVCVEIIGYYFLSLNLLPGFQFNSNPIPLSYLFIPLGGFIFGVGTVFAGGCAGGTCYRIGEGSVASLLSFLGFAGGIGLIGIVFDQPVEQLRTQTLLKINNETPTLTHFLPRWIWTIVSLFILLITIIYYQRKKIEGQLKLQHLLPNWSPIRTGLAIGVLGVAARYFSSLSGREFGLSTTDGIAEIVQIPLLQEPPGWAGIFILGLIIGSLLSSFRGGEFSISIPEGKEIIRFFGGGLLLGIGAMLGLGCNFGHIFGGMPELGISSFISVIFMFIGNGVASVFFYQKLGATLPISTPQPLNR